MALDTSTLRIDFDVLPSGTNCKVLKIVDLSNWASLISSPSFVDITTPGQTVPVSTTFYKGQINLLNSNNLQLSDVTDYSALANLPDGAYKICVKVCMGSIPSTTEPPLPPTPVFEEVCKWHLQDCQIKCKIARKLTSVDLTCQPCRKYLLEYLREINLYLAAAHAQIDDCNVNKAMEYYRRATELLERLNEPGSNNPCRNCGSSKQVFNEWGGW